MIVTSTGIQRSALFCMRSKKIIPYVSTEGSANRGNNQSAEYSVISTEKVQILNKCRGHNEAGWEMRNSSLEYERSIHDSIEHSGEEGVSSLVVCAVKLLYHLPDGREEKRE